MHRLRSARGRVLVTAIALIAGGLTFVLMPSANAVHSTPGGIQLDGDISSATSGNFGAATVPFSYSSSSFSSQVDWDRFFCAQDAAQVNCPKPVSSPAFTTASGDIGISTAAFPDGYISSGIADTPEGSAPPTATSDYTLADNTTYATGSKDTEPIKHDPSASNNWQCASSNNLSAKDDLLNAYGVAFRVASNAAAAANDLIVYFGAEKSSNLGDNNIGLWLLKDPSVACSSSKGALDFEGQHTDGDVLLTAAFTNGGTTATVDAFRWNKGPSGLTGIGQAGDGSISSTPFATSNVCPVPGTSPVSTPAFNDDLCAITNLTSVNPPWTSTTQAKTTCPTYKGCPSGSASGLAPQEFYEGGLDLTALGLTGCFNRFIVDTRSSQSPTATLFDYALGTLPTCASLTVHKYIDVNANGANDNPGNNTGDINSGSAVSTWPFKVYSGSNTTTGTPVCQGFTNSNGNFSCADLPSGPYTVVETQQNDGTATGFSSPAGTNFYNTDPGPNPNTAATISMNVTMGADNKTVQFGNTCLVKKKFQIDNVPSGQPQLFVQYFLNGSSTPAYLQLSTSGTTASAAIATFFPTDTITWNWGEDQAGTTTPDTTHVVNGNTAEALTGGDYPSCFVLNEVNFPNATIVGLKYKDANADGSQDNGEVAPSVPFTFDIYSGSSTAPFANTTSSTVAFNQSSVAYAAGTFLFTNIAPGTYTIKERSKTGWLQTQPAVVGGVPGSVTVTVHLGDTSVTLDNSDNTIEFGNTPLTDLNIKVTPETNPAVTHATSIDCGTAGSSTSTNSFNTTGLEDGPYVCTIVIADP